MPRALPWRLALALLFASTACAVGVGDPPSAPEPTVEVMHWATGHLFRDGLLPEMADQFNAERHRTDSGRLIVDRSPDAFPSSLQRAVARLP